MNIKNNKEFFQNNIIKWYDFNHRKFPWRETRDPFKILIAEIILKQTGAWKAEKVYNYIANHYGTPEKMQQASPDKLKELFKPLGLVKRSQLLIDIAKDIEGRFSGEVPNTPDKLLSIKGIGNYICNAILFFAYNQRVPLVDGSISRIFKRCFNYKTSKEAYADKKLWELAEQYMPEKEYRKYNIGLLDLGALICKHHKPLHEKCPVKEICYHIKYK